MWLTDGKVHFVFFLFLESLPALAGRLSFSSSSCNFWHEEVRLDASFCSFLCSLACASNLCTHPQHKEHISSFFSHPPNNYYLRAQCCVGFFEFFCLLSTLLLPDFRVSLLLCYSLFGTPFLRVDKSPPRLLLYIQLL